MEDNNNVNTNNFGSASTNTSQNNENIKQQNDVNACKMQNAKPVFQTQPYYFASPEIQQQYNKQVIKNTITQFFPNLVKKHPLIISFFAWFGLCCSNLFSGIFTNIFFQKNNKNLICSNQKLEKISQKKIQKKSKRV